MNHSLVPPAHVHSEICLWQCVAACYNSQPEAKHSPHLHCRAAQEASAPFASSHCCSVLQRVAVSCSVLQCVASACCLLSAQDSCSDTLHLEAQSVAARCVLQCRGVSPLSYNVLQCLAVSCSVLQRLAASCSVWKCVALAEARWIWRHSLTRPSKMRLKA